MRQRKEASKTSLLILAFIMRTLQVLLTVLDGQKLGPGYLTPSATALQTMIDLKRQLDTVTINKASYQSPGNVLFSSAWVASLRAGQDAIYLADVDGNLNKANGPAYVFLPPTA
jgi:hypothetical protein